MSPRRPLRDAVPLGQAERALADALPCVVYVSALDCLGAFSYVSAAVETILGDAPAAWMGQGRLWLERLHPDDRWRVLRDQKRARGGEQGFYCEYRLAGADGRHRWVRDEAFLRGPAPFVGLYWLGTWTDLSGQRRAEAELREARGEGDRAREHLGRLLQAAAHVLRSPLRQIAGLSEIAARRRPADAQLETLLRALSDSARVLDQRLAQNARHVEAFLAPLSVEDCDTAEVLRGALALLEAPLARRRAQVTSAELPRVRADPRRLREILSFLIETALERAGDGPARVHVFGRRVGGRPALFVRDYGPGFDTRRLRTLFEPFGPAAAEESGGQTFASCRELVERMDGRLWAVSEPGVGATLCLSLPPAGRP